MKPLNRRKFVALASGAAGVAIAVPARAGGVLMQQASSGGGPPPNLPFVSPQATDNIQLNDDGSFTMPANIPAADQAALIAKAASTPNSNYCFWPAVGGVATSLDNQAVQNWMVNNTPSGFVLNAPAPISQPQVALFAVVIVVVVVVIVLGVVFYVLYKLTQLLNK